MNMESAKNFLKKHGVAVAALVGGVIIWYIIRRSSSSSSTTASQAYPVPVTPQYVVSGGTSAGGAGTTTNSAPTVQPSTAASGVPNSTVTPYVSPTTVAPTTPATQTAATGNPFSYTPTPGNLAPNVAPQNIAQFSISPPGAPVISSIEAALTGNVSSTPAGGATMVDPAIMAALKVGSQPGDLAALPSANPYLTSPGFENLQKAQLAGPGCCTPDAMGNGGPNSPCCQVSIATGELGTGAPTSASIAYKTTSYCEQNQFNAQFFGNPSDTANCAGTTPTSQLIVQSLNNYIPQSNVNQPTQVQPTAPPPSPTIPVTQSVI